MINFVDSLSFDSFSLSSVLIFNSMIVPFLIVANSAGNDEVFSTVFVASAVDFSPFCVISDD
jgi:hypothetical protein